jgi:hypothetical protein
MRDELSDTEALWKSRAQIAEAQVSSLTAENERLKELSDSALFHQLGCMGGCHESLASLARLAQAIGYKTDPWEQQELDAALCAPQDRGKTHDCYRDEQREFKARAEAAEQQLAEARKALEVIERDALPDRASARARAFLAALPPETKP